MSPGRHRPALSPHGCGGAAPSAAPAPTSRPPRREGSPGQLCTKRQGPHCRAVPRVPAQLPAQRGPARSARGAAHERPPPGQRGVRRPRGSRVGGAARGPGPSLRARSAGCVRDQGAGRRGVRGASGARRRVRGARSGPLRPRPPPLPHLPAAGDMFRPPPARWPRPLQATPPARPTPRPVPPWIPPQPRRGQLPVRGSPSRASAEGDWGVTVELEAWERGDAEVRWQTARGECRDYLPARRRT